MDSSDLERDLRTRAFGLGRPPGPDGRIGIEVELIPVDAESRRVVGPEGTAGAIRDRTAALGWSESISAFGAPRFHTPGGGTVSYEPGGQIEFSSPVRETVRGLVTETRGVVHILREVLGEAGVDLVSRGIDPFNPADSARLFLSNERYTRMAAYLEDYGDAGRRMMRQTAAIHVNLGLGADPLGRFELLQRLTPYLIAIFANSSVYAGAQTGFRSFRARQWRLLDPRRTGLVEGPDAVSGLLGSALAAPALFFGSDGDPLLPFEAWIREGEVTMADWHRHLSTLFHEVRARGYLEVRAIDALDPVDYGAPLVFLVGITHDRRAAESAMEILPAATSDDLERAASSGLRDERLRRVAEELWDLALTGAGRAAGGVLCEADLEQARDFAARYVRQGLDPAAETDAEDLGALAPAS
jgi:glutamate--cysteine ligase